MAITSKSAKKKIKIAKRKNKQALLPPSVHAFLAHRLTDIVGGLVCFFGAFVLIAVLSYHVDDPSLNTAVGSIYSVQNILGLWGAYTADLLLQALGLGGVLMGVLPVIWGVRILTRRPLKPVWMRLAFVFPAVLLASLVCARIPAFGGWALGSYFGGSVGVLLFNNITQSLQGFMGNFAHSAVFLLSLGLFLPAFSFASGLSLQIWKDGFKGALRWSIVAKQRAEYFMRSLLNWHETHSHISEPARAVKVPLLKKPENKRPAPDVTLAPKKKPLIASVPQAKKSKNKIAAEKQPSLALTVNDGQWSSPELTLLDEPPVTQGRQLDETALQQNAELLQSTLGDFGVQGDVVKVNPGPVVTLYELEPAPGTKSARVIGLSDDIARSMSSVSVRVAVIPGQNALGIELPNLKRETVFLKELLSTNDYDQTKANLPLALGKDIGGSPVIADLAKMPHLLVAGTTGSGKSVAVNTMILSLLYSLSPEQCRFIMIDPKMLELSVYDDIPHLLTPVVTEPTKAIVALKWAVREMEDRYRAMSKLGVRNIQGFNARVLKAQETGEVLMHKVQTGFDLESGKPVYEEQIIENVELPYIVIIVDEFADLMLVAGKEVENAIQRLAQMARAAGIHLIMATQRPSVDVITGVIKANFPTRISFQVTSKIDSRTILGEGGAESLLGNGDMLYMAAGGKLRRVHGPFVDDGEVEHVVNYLKSQGEPVYIDGVTEGDDDGVFGDGEGGGDQGYDELYDHAVALIIKEGKVSTSFIQRNLQIGYNRAARIVEMMEREGLISSANRAGRRQILVDHAE